MSGCNVLPMIREVSPEYTLLLKSYATPTRG